MQAVAVINKLRNNRLILKKKATGERLLHGHIKIQRKDIMIVVMTVVSVCELECICNQSKRISVALNHII